MLARIFPRQIDNNFRGHWLAIWFLVPVVLMKLVIGVNGTINARSVATGADGIPLDSYTAAGAQAVVALFALLSFTLLLIALQSVVVLIRYRALIPFTYLLLLLQQLGGKLLGLVNPIARAGAATVGAFPIGALITYGLLAMLVIGFGLSLMNRPSNPSGRTSP